MYVSRRYAHANYQSNLKENQSPLQDIRATSLKETRVSNQNEKRKKKVHEELHLSRTKKERLGKMVQELTKEADALAKTEWIC